MNIIGVQLIILGFAMFMEYVLYLHLKKNNISTKMFLLWTVVWLVLVIFTLFPKILEPIVKDLFFVRVMDLGMIGAFMVISYISIENNIRVKKQDDRIEQLVRTISLNTKNEE